MEFNALAGFSSGLRAFDPFAGVGAFGMSMEGSGAIRVTHAVEISPSAAATMKYVPLSHLLLMLIVYLERTPHPLWCTTNAPIQS